MTDSAQAQLAAAIRNIAQRFRCVEGPPSAWAPTFEPYEAIITGGIHAEGTEPSVYCRRAEDAVRYWLADFWRYAARKTGTLYWRAMPAIESCSIHLDRSAQFRMVVFEPIETFSVYARLLISDKPVLSWEDWPFEPVMPAAEWQARYAA